ncbi:MAG: hypothetical protein RL557_781 [archaeon]|jgi:mRNA interferase MazF
MIKKGELWVVEFLAKKGKEQEGKRPAIIIADTITSLVLVVPLTSNREALEKLLFTLFIEKSSINKLFNDSVALVFQLQAVDKKRLVSKISVLEEDYMGKIDATLKKLLQL